MKKSHRLVAGSLVALVITGCSTGVQERREAKNDFTYLNTSPLTEWTAAPNTLPYVYKDYEIPKGDFTGAKGKNVDIRSPKLALALLSGSIVEMLPPQSDQLAAILWLPSASVSANYWGSIAHSLLLHEIKIATQSDHQIDTQWVNWQLKDETKALLASYRIESISQGARHGIKISIIDWQQDGKAIKPSSFEAERYISYMMNYLSASYEAKQKQLASKKLADENVMLTISMGSDRSGLAVMIVREPYGDFWLRASDLLPMMGFEITDKNESQGTINVKYSKPNEAFWQTLGIKPISLSSGQYIFQLGDLVNRTSINLNDTTGKPIDEQKLTELLAVFAKIKPAQQ